MTDEVVEDKRIKLIANRATSSVNTFVTEFPDVTVFDVMEYVKFLTVYGAKVIAESSLKEGKHPNVRTVINDICASSIETMEALASINPELADDYVWPGDAVAEEETSETDTKTE